MNAKKILRKYIIALVIIFALSWIPLVGAFDYEAAFVTALAGIIFIPILAPKKVDQSARSLAISLLSGVLFWLVSASLMALTAWIRGELCNFEQGLAFQTLIAFPGILLAALVWGWCSRITSFGFLQKILYIFAVLLDFGVTFFALYNWPPIVSFGQFYGYFAGSIYDESIDIIHALMHWRVGTAALCLCLFFAQTNHAGIARKLLLPVVGILIAAGNYYWLSESEEITPIGRSKIDQALWQTVGNDDYTVHFVPKSKKRRALEEEKYRIRSAFDRDYDYLKDFFQAKPNAPIDIWLYPTAEVKGHYIGAERTSFSRVWKNEIHLVESSPDSTLARHEMAHLFAGSFGLPPLNIAGGMHIPAMGWIEGLAMSAEWPFNNYDLHTWSAAILARKDVFPEISSHQIMYGFWGLPGRVAYTLAGSWVRWLIEHYGIEKVKVLSQGMPGDFDEVIGISFNDAFDAWKSDLRAHHYRQNAVDTVDMVFGAASIWTKHCARAHAAENAAWYRCLEDEYCSVDKVKPIFTATTCDQSEEPTLQDLERVYYYYLLRGPLDDTRLNSADILLDAHFSVFYPTMTEVLREMPKSEAAELRTAMFNLYDQLDEEKIPAAARVIWQERRADMLYQAGFDQIAGLMYDAMMRQPLPETVMRRLEIKQRAAMTPQSPVSQAVRRWFFGDEDKSRIAMRFEHAQIIAYLDFLEAINHREYARAREDLIHIFLYTGSQDYASRLTARCWKVVLHWIPYI